MTDHPNSNDWFEGVIRILLGVGAWFASNINAFVGIASLILVCSQIYILWRNELRRRKEK